jgi:hypothetical protein
MSMSNLINFTLHEMASLLDPIFPFQALLNHVRNELYFTTFSDHFALCACANLMEG